MRWRVTAHAATKIPPIIVSPARHLRSGYTAAMNTRQILLLALVLALLTFLLPMAGDAGQWLFDQLKLHQTQLAVFARDHALLAGLGYVALFVAATSLSMPVATVLTVGAGAIFGFTEALLLTVLAGASGATLAMLLARYAFLTRVEAHWPDWVARINRGITHDGPFYLLSLRLAPVPPFFVVNVAMGLTRMPARTFFLVSLVGIAPLDAVFVNAGHMLAQMQTPDDAMSLPMLVTFALIGIVPLLLRKALRRWRKHRQHVQHRHERRDSQEEP